MAGTPESAPGPFHVRNEFAAVELHIVPYGRGSRLHIAAGRTKSTGAIDATVLEALTLLTESELMQIVAYATDPETGGARLFGPPAAGHVETGDRVGAADAAGRRN
ncbi:hypothetical protein [Streptomyces sp. NPDC046821]|uniref:hypothetical protein n=1 Tax=Streptomyces sp. NPDC046821 TaxID=3154702 RepID=UPI00340CB9DF